VTIWLDNQLPPALATWVRATLGVDCTSVRDLALQRAADLDIFHAARDAGALVIRMRISLRSWTSSGRRRRSCSSPCGNTSNAHLRRVLGTAWPTVREMLERGEPLVEIGDRPR
jgi:predicted nuclease of predicted toxin-antitoxin system